MNSTMKKRWISLFVENQVGVLPKISGLFSGKLYNLDSLLASILLLCLHVHTDNSKQPQLYVADPGL